MSNDKVHVNHIKFAVFQGESVLVERIFSADEFNPVVRYTIDVRDILPSIIQRLQRTLSRRNLNYKDYFGKDKDGNLITIDLLKSYKDELVKYDFHVPNKLEKPEITKQNIHGKTLKGVECKFGLYINDNPIVERDFYVDNYNTTSRFSLELVEVVNEITDEIFLKIKNSDVNHMWEDYDLINVYGLHHIQQIRDLSHKQRRDMLANINSSSYVNRVRNTFRSQQVQNQEEA